ncbi:Aldo/keto reductase [Dacryopinax primogenitus]|uniref:Aldo/keto reductase n=1 Tax=Dacryopinax primogenitus (strain DJM 731) TaxID=1858805 RepID=M5FS58_DACPD|nr:Aldo/keto reductase [Dacryopinax primogenitus]EJT98628.1 Aldo/keto reductase [Dacryopinax primogenitus]
MRKIGNTSVPVPGWGLMGFSAFYATDKTEDDFVPVFKVAYDAGCRMWDTADIYSRESLGQNERLVAKAMRELKIPRKDIFLCTKFGWLPGLTGIRGDPEYVKSAIERSLKPGDVRAMQELKDAGKIRYIGLSECSAETLRRASKVAKIDAVQWEYSLWETSIETNGVLDACKELGIALVAYSPLGRGMLRSACGKFRQRSDLAADDVRLGLPRFSEENFPKLGLAWVLAQWEGILVIPGTTRVAALEENIGAATVTLTAEELEEIRKVLDSFPVAGNRYDAEMLSNSNA